MLNLSAVIEQHTRRRPDAEALVCGDTRLTYVQLNAWANQIANALAASGIPPCRGAGAAQALNRRTKARRQIAPAMSCG